LPASSASTPLRICSRASGFRPRTTACTVPSLPIGTADGTSGTLMAGERPQGANLRLGRWYNGGRQNLTGSLDAVLSVREPNLHPQAVPDCPQPRYRFEPGEFRDNCDVFHFWSPHPGGANFLFTDRSVRFLACTDAPLMPALASRAGGEVVSE
jgi:prepilin-type processing-associated H-X9-DG protein